MYDEERPYEMIEKPSHARRKANWDMSAGLQAVDGLHVSDYASRIAEEYISGARTARDLKIEIEKHYSLDTYIGNRQAEADVVATRINELIESSGSVRFEINQETLKGIHRSLFCGLLKSEWVGQFRSENIYKREPVLGGRTVEYSDYNLIEAQLRYDLEAECAFDYRKATDESRIEHIADIVSNIWQIHPFREGNTRTIAVVSEMKLRSLGYSVDNEIFKEHSVWFRDALVRASYASIPEDVEEDRSFIRMFYENAVFNSGHDLLGTDLNLHGVRVLEGYPYRTVESYRSPSWKETKRRIQNAQKAEPGPDSQGITNPDKGLSR